MDKQDGRDKKRHGRITEGGFSNPPYKGHGGSPTNRARTKLEILEKIGV